MKRGLYILETTKLKKDNTVKMGMSLKLENRRKHYLNTFGDSYYLYCYEIPDLNRKEILYLEALVLKETKEARNFDYATEYRIMDYNLLHKTIISYLEHYNVKYEIHENPIFNNVVDLNNVLDDENIMDNNNYSDYNFEESLQNPPESFKQLNPKTETTKITSVLETEGFTDIKIIDNNRIIANKNNDLYIIKKRDAKKLQEKPYNAFTRDNKISNHYNEISSLLPNKKYNDINYCYLIVNNDNYFLAELKNINKKYSIDNIKNGICDDEIITVKQNDMKHLKC